ncbi:hypothetical protein ENSA5_10020 [Enhygromyxa salina]|uniref:Dipeptide-binding ABC transporter, periplasmic substrate-binding component n=1 Tax=Enhygromyxa salina TaxID=215803 RepID=A0A2S9YGI4_9BACT|nr:hypothetical protein [Enhygromyxa salina]PRQ04218.1 hypothetical protein ENSA5_10020 [Enhygromyxa salina]
MRTRLTTPLILGLSLSCFGLVACGDSVADTGAEDDTTGDGDTDSGTDTDTGDGDGDPGDGDGDPGDGDGDPGDGDGDTGDGDGDTGDGDGDTGDGDGDSGCQVWEITYDLEGSIFEISDTPAGEGDQVNTLTMPYDADDHVGPGSFVLRFRDVGGEPGDMAYMYSYDMIMNFVVGGAVTVTTDLQNNAGPEECGITSAPINGTSVAWDPLAIVDHHSMGTILCEGFLCGLGGFQDGVPEDFDETTNHPLEPFEFSDDFTTFNMPTVVVQMDSDSTTTWTFEGTEASRELVNADACLCE